MRSLYYGGRPYDFFVQVLASVHSGLTLQWLKSSPNWLLHEFFNFLAWYLPLKEAEVPSLHFLIHLYEPALDTYYLPLIAGFNLEQCRYLLSRSANPSLRSLLKNREEQLLQEYDRLYYGLLPARELGSPQLADDEKANLLKQALLRLNQTNPDNYSDPNGPERFLALMETAELTFQCGLLPDAFLLVKKIYQEYEYQNRLMEILADQRLTQKMQQLLSRIVGMLLLLGQGLRFREEVHSLYQAHFPRFTVDNRLQAIFKLYEAILAGDRQETSVPWEVRYAYDSLHQHYPGEINLPEMGEHTEYLLSGKALIKVIKVLLPFSPHEAFIIMELSRFMLQRSQLQIDSFQGEELLKCYTVLWKWVPSSRFMHSGITAQLGPWSASSLRQEAERMAALTGNWEQSKLAVDLHSRPDLFRSRIDPLRCQALAGFLLGVPQ